MDANKEKTIGEIRALEEDLLQRYTLEELEANPELLADLPEKVRETFVEKQRAWRKVQEDNREALDALREELRATTDTYNRIIQQAAKKYGLTKKEIEDLLANDPEVNIISFGDFVAQSITDEDKLALDGLLATIIKKSKKARKPIREYVTKAEEGLNLPSTALKTYLQDPKAFMVAPVPRGMDLFMRINDKAGMRDYTNINGVKIIFPERLGINEQKINGLIRIAFADANYYGAATNINPYIELPLRETLRKLKKKPTEANIKKYIQRLRTNILPAVAQQHIDIFIEYPQKEGEKKKKQPDGVWKHIDIGGGYFEIDKAADKIVFRISDGYAMYLSKKPLTQYSSITFELGDQNNPLPFYLALKLQDHYFRDGNRARSTNAILSVKTLLEFCEDTIPSYEYIQAKDPGHWIREIRTRLEKALNDIQDGGLFEWEYCKQGMAEVTKAETETKDYWEWSRLYITFKLIPKEPDQTARLQNKQARLEAAAAKKEEQGTSEPETGDKRTRSAGQTNPKQGTSEPEGKSEKPHK